MPASVAEGVNAYGEKEQDSEGTEVFMPGSGDNIVDNPYFRDFILVLSPSYFTV